MNAPFRHASFVIVIGLLSACNAERSTDATNPSSASHSAEQAASADSDSAGQDGMAVPFTENVMSIPVGGFCSFDTVNGRPVSDGRIEWGRSEVAVASGWIMEQAGVVPKTSLLVMHGNMGQYSIKLTTGMSRPDVAEALGKPELLTAGFESPADLRSIPAGNYELTIVTQDGTTRRCPLNVMLALAE